MLDVLSPRLTDRHRDAFADIAGGWRWGRLPSQDPSIRVRLVGFCIFPEHFNYEYRYRRVAYNTRSCDGAVGMAVKAKALTKFCLPNRQRLCADGVVWNARHPPVYYNGLESQAERYTSSVDYCQETGEGSEA